MTSLKTLDPNVLSIIYDGECPFCNSYVKLVRLRDGVGQVELIDGRTRIDVIKELNSIGLDINQGMVVQYRNQIFYGGNAMNILANLSTKSGFWNRLISLFLRHKYLSTTFYPLLKGIRNITIGLLQRKPISME